MTERGPPKLALWLLRHFASAYHSESLAGDLIEQYREGRSEAWCWRQVAAAVVAGRARFVRGMPWTAICAVLSRLLAEVAAVLAVTVIVDQARRTHSLGHMMTQSFVATVVVLTSMALVGFLLSIRAHGRKQAHAAVNALMLVFAVIALGLGTITWADTLRGHDDPVAACSSSN
jgi:hypothetical protein